MVATKPCLKVCCSTDQTEETSSCHLESNRAGGTAPGLRRCSQAPSYCWHQGCGARWSIPGMHEAGLGTRPGGGHTSRGGIPGGASPASGSSKACSVLNHRTSLLASFPLSFSLFFFHLLCVYSGLEPLSFAPGTKSSGFPLVLLLPGLRYSKTKSSRKI